MLSMTSTSVVSPPLKPVDEGVARPRAAQHLQPFRVQHEVGIASLVHALTDLLLGLVEAVELVEADVVRPHALRLADVPLARQHRGVAGFAEQRRQRDLVGPGILRDVVAREDRTGEPGPDRQTSGQDRRPRRRAGRLRIGRGQLQPLARQPVHVRRRRPDRRAAAEGAGVAVAHVVDDEPDDVRPLACLGEERVELRLRRRGLVGMDQRGLEALARAHRLAEHRLRVPSAGGERQRGGEKQRRPSHHLVPCERWPGFGQPIRPAAGKSLFPGTSGGFTRGCPWRRARSRRRPWPCRRGRRGCRRGRTRRRRWRCPWPWPARRR